jgi:LysR family transcriptional regulator, glycine cleavage system transcriptional activator
MSTRLPLNALHVFCTVVQAGGVRPAAELLCVTPGAVSRQLQALESQLGETLFERLPGRVSLTPAGQRLHQRAAAPLASLAELLAGGPKRAARASLVRVDCGVTLAMHWLIPRLRGFAEHHPRIEVQVRTTNGDIDANSPADVFIRRETHELRDLPSETFLAERALLVASASHPALPAPAGRRGLARWPRIAARSRPDLWPTWATAQRLPVADWEPTLWFDNTVLAIQAAAQGLGLCVLPELFITDLLQTGTLRPVLPRRIDSGSYALAVGRGRDAARVRHFIDWLRREAVG